MNANPETDVAPTDPGTSLLTHQRLDRRVGGIKGTLCSMWKYEPPPGNWWHRFKREGRDRLQVQVATSRRMSHYFERESSLPRALTGESVDGYVCAVVLASALARRLTARSMCS